MSDTFKSKLKDGIFYDKYFENQELEDLDAGIETDLYKISIFGNSHHIAMGKMNSHDDDDTLKFYNTYLIYSDKVIMKIGIYEALQDDIDAVTKESGQSFVPEFEKMELLIHPKYYAPPFYLDQFSVNDDTNLEDSKFDVASEAANYEAKQELNADDADTEDNENMVHIVSGFTLTSGSMENEDAMYDLIEKLTNNGELFQQLGMVVPLTIKSIQSFVSKGISNEKFRKAIQSIALKLFQKSYVKDNEKNRTIVLYDYLQRRNGINPVILFALEYICNVKFIIVNDGKINNFGLFATGAYNQPYDYVSDIMKYDKIDDNMRNKLSAQFKKYNPDTFIFLQYHDKKYYPMALNGKTMVRLDDIPKEGLEFLRDLYDKGLDKEDKKSKQMHEYMYPEQLTSFKSNDVSEETGTTETSEPIDVEDVDVDVIPENDNENDNEVSKIEESKPAENQNSKLKLQNKLKLLKEKRKEQAKLKLKTEG